MHKVETATVPMMAGRELHKYLEVKQDYKLWINNVLEDERFIRNYNFWFYDSQNPEAEPSGENIMIGMYAAKALARDQHTIKGQVAAERLSEFDEISGFYTVLNFNRSEDL